MTNKQQTIRRMPTTMADVMSCVGRRVSTHEYDKARTEACHLLGIPDLISMSESRREQNKLKRIERVIRHVAKFMRDSRSNSAIATDFEDELDRLNKSIDAMNSFMESNPLRFGFKKHITLLHIDKERLSEMGVVFIRRTIDQPTPKYLTTITHIKGLDFDDPDAYVMVRVR